MSQTLLRSEIRTENDIVTARSRTRQIASYLKIDKQEEIRLATAVSEMARNVYQYAKKGSIEYRLELKKDKCWFMVEIRDNGPGIKQIQTIMDGRYVSPEGMGVGIVGSQKLVEEFQLKTSENGTQVILGKVVPLRISLMSAKELTKLIDSFVVTHTQDAVEEIQKQNQEILLTLQALNEKKDELSRLNKELEETNRGVLALYAELDEKAESLRKANESKTSFLSDMTHEFRSPLNSILSISQILLQDTKESKNPDHEKQINFIIKAARGLSDLVNDLLDIAKIEAGKIPVRVQDFSLNELFGTMRGLYRPLNINPKVELEIDELNLDMKIKTDEAKLTQILRNLITNGLKYTEEGKVRLTAKKSDKQVEFTVSDTGIGIPEDQLENIFYEFYQVEHPLQSKQKGTGLGLPLTRKLSNLLGGSISVESKLGKGTTFHVKIPLQYQGPEIANYQPIEKEINPLLPKLRKLLVIDDEELRRDEIKNLLKNDSIELRECINGQEGLKAARDWKPDLIILDLVMPVMDGYDFIKESLSMDEVRDIPIILYTSKELEIEETQYLEQMTMKIISKDEKGLSELKAIITDLKEKL